MGSTTIHRTFPDGANNLASVRLSKLPEALRVATDEEIAEFMATAFADPHHQAAARAEVERRAGHYLVRVWNEGEKGNHTYAYRCSCGHVERDFIYDHYARDGHTEHVQEA